MTIRLTNTSDSLQVIPGKNGSKDLPVGGTDSFNITADNPHVAAKIAAGLIALAPAASASGGGKTAAGSTDPA